jgi:hypothetical protein
MMAGDKAAQATSPSTYTIQQYGETVKVRPRLGYYTNVTDILGEPMRNLAITLDDVHDGEQYTAVTVNLGEFIVIPASAYIDTNNNPGIGAWLEDNGIARLTGQTRQSGYCTYPLAVFDEGFLNTVDDGTLAGYLKQFEPPSIDTSHAAWVICGKGEKGKELWFYESHETDDEWSPTGTGWYFASWFKDQNGKWAEYDGGCFWDYRFATELEEAIGETLPFKEYCYKNIPYEDFEAVCTGGDSAKEAAYRAQYGVAAPKHQPKEKTFDVTICETLKRTVQVKANNEDEAHQKVEDGWKNELHVLGPDDFEEVYFTASERSRDKGIER